MILFLKLVKKTMEICKKFGWSKYSCDSAQACKYLAYLSSKMKYSSVINYYQTKILSQCGRTYSSRVVRQFIYLFFFFLLRKQLQGKPWSSSHDIGSIYIVCMVKNRMYTIIRILKGRVIIHRDFRLRIRTRINILTKRKKKKFENLEIIYEMWV